MHFTIQTSHTDGTVQHETCVDMPDLRAALSWALRNWHPAQAERIASGPTKDGFHFYLNDRLMVSVDNGGFVNVRDALQGGGAGA